MGTRHERLRMAGPVSARLQECRWPWGGRHGAATSSCSVLVTRGLWPKSAKATSSSHLPVSMVGVRCLALGAPPAPRHLLLGVVLLIPTPALLQGSAWDSGLTTSAWPSWAAVMGLSVALQPRARIRDGRKLVLGPWREMALVSAGTWDLSCRPEASDHHAEPAMTRT